MNGLTTAFVILFGLLLMGAILLQPGSKGGGLGSSFGGGGANSAFGAQGATPFLAKATYWLAGAFLLTTTYIEYAIVKDSHSVLERAPITSHAAAPKPPAAPAATPAIVPATPSAAPAAATPAPAPAKKQG